MAKIDEKSQFFRDDTEKNVGGDGSKMRLEDRWLGGYFRN